MLLLGKLREGDTLKLHEKRESWWGVKVSENDAKVDQQSIKNRVCDGAQNWKNKKKAQQHNFESRKSREIIPIVNPERQWTS